MAVSQSRFTIVDESTVKPASRFTIVDEPEITTSPIISSVPAIPEQPIVKPSTDMPLGDINDLLDKKLGSYFKPTAIRPISATQESTQIEQPVLAERPVVRREEAPILTEMPTDERKREIVSPGEIRQTPQKGMRDALREIYKEPLELMPFISTADDIGFWVAEYPDAKQNLDKVGGDESKLTGEDRGIITEAHRRRGEMPMPQTNIRYDITKGIANLIPYATEFLFTSGVRPVGEMALKSVLGKYAPKAIQKLGGITLQVAAKDVPRIVERTLASKKPVKQALPEAIAREWVQTTSENYLNIVKALPGKKLITKIIPKGVYKNAIVRAIASKNPTITNETIKKIGERASYHGLIGEWTEERVADVMDYALDLEPKLHIPNGREFVTELAILSAYPIAGKVGELAMGKPPTPPLTGKEYVTQTEPYRRDETTGKIIFKPEEVNLPQTVEGSAATFKEEIGRDELYGLTPAEQSAKVFENARVEAEQVNKSVVGREELRKKLLTEESISQRNKRNADIEASNQLADEAIKNRLDKTETKNLRNTIFDAMRDRELDFEDLPALAESFRSDGKDLQATIIEEIYTKPTISPEAPMPPVTGEITPQIPTISPEVTKETPAPPEVTGEPVTAKPEVPISSELQPLADEAKKYKSADEFIASPQFEYHLSTDPNLIGKTIKGEQVFTTKTPSEWSVQLQYEREGKTPPENLYLVKVENPSADYTGYYGHETVSPPNEVKVISKIGNIDKMFGDSPISISKVESIKKQQLTDFYNQAVSKPEVTPSRFTIVEEEVKPQVPVAEKPVETKPTEDIAITETPTETIVKPTIPKSAEKKMTFKEQKSFLIDEIDKAIENATEEGKVTIVVPADGEFTIDNTKESLNKFKDIVQANFPATETKIGIPKPNKPSTRPTGKRVIGAGISYYNEFKPRKQGIITATKRQDTDIYVSGYYTDGAYWIKTDKKPVFKGEEREVTPEVFNSATIDRRKDAVPSKILAEYYNTETLEETDIKDVPVKVHIETETGEHFALNAQHVDAILTKYPDAKTFTVPDTGLTFFEKNGEIVGGITSQTYYNEETRKYEPTSGKLEEITSAPEWLQEKYNKLTGKEITTELTIAEKPITARPLGEPKKVGEIIPDDPAVTKGINIKIGRSWIKDFPEKPEYRKLSDDDLAAIKRGLPKYRNNMTRDQEEISAAVYREQTRRFVIKDLANKSETASNYATIEAKGYWDNGKPFPKDGEQVTGMYPGLFGMPMTIDGIAKRRGNGTWYVKVTSPAVGGNKMPPLSPIWTPVREEKPVVAEKVITMTTDEITTKWKSDIEYSKRKEIPSDKNRITNTISGITTEGTQKSIQESFIREKEQALGYLAEGLEIPRGNISERMDAKREDSKLAGETKYAVREGRITPIVEQSIIKQVVKEFGTTDNINEAGYLLTDGILLDFSGKREGGEPNQRSYDHRQISGNIEELHGGSAGMQEFMNMGNIRLLPESGGIDMVQPPTEKQVSILKNLIDKRNGEVILDLEHGLGEYESKNEYYRNPIEEKFNKEYPKGTQTSRILSDINKFYQGELKQRSEDLIQKYHYATGKVTPTSAGITLADVKKMYPYADNVGQDSEGNFWMDINERRLKIESVEAITPNEAQFNITYKRTMKAGEVIAGSYSKGVIKVSKAGDIWTIGHEDFHWLRDLGVLTSDDIYAINQAIKNRVDITKDRITDEDRAKYIEGERQKRSENRDKGFISRIIQKIQDWIDSMVNLFHRTARGVVRDIETGKVLKRKGVAKVGVGEQYATVEPTEVPSKRSIDKLQLPEPPRVTSQFTPFIRKEMKRSFKKKVGVFDTIEQAYQMVLKARDIGENTVPYVMSYIRQAGDITKEFGIDDKGMATLVANPEGLSLAINDVLSNYTHYDLTPKQVEIAKRQGEVYREALKLAKSYGVNITELGGPDEFWQYIARRVKSKLDPLTGEYVAPPSIIGGFKMGAKISAQKERVFDEMSQGIDKGFLYENPDRVMATHLRGIYRLIGNKQAEILITPLTREITKEKPLHFGERAIYEPALKSRAAAVEVANAIDKIFMPKQESKTLRVAADVSGVMVGQIAALDVSAPFIQGLPVLGHDLKMGLKGKPSTIWAESYGHMWKAVVNPETINNFRMKNKDLYKRAIEAGIITGESEFVVGVGIAERGLGKIPVVGKTLREAYRQTWGRMGASYSDFLEVAKIKYFEQMEPVWLKSGRNIYELGALINRMTGATSAKARGISPNRHNTERILLFAPNYLRSSLLLIKDMIGTGAKAREVQASLAALLGIFAAFYYAEEKLRGKTPKMKPWPKRLGGDGADAYTIVVGNTRIGLGSWMYGMIKTLSEVGAIAVDDPKALIVWDSRHPIVRLVKSKRGPLLGLITELATGRNFYGQKFENANDYLMRVAESFIPIAGQSLIEKSELGIPSKPAEIATRVGAELMGWRAYPYTLRSKWEKDFKEYNAIPTSFIEVKAKRLESREKYRKKHSDIDAKLFITGAVGTILSLRAMYRAIDLIKENKIDHNMIKGVKENRKNRAEYEKFGGKKRSILQDYLQGKETETYTTRLVDKLDKEQ